MMMSSYSGAKSGVELAAVYLNDVLVGTLRREAGGCDFVFSGEYLAMSPRPVLGLWFEDDPTRRCHGPGVLPAWFSNLLPEGHMRQMAAAAVGGDDEFAILLRLGTDLPGAVKVIETHDDLAGVPVGRKPASPGELEDLDVWRFSLAGVMPKFSMARESEKFVLPAKIDRGHFIVKLPDFQHEKVPLNEFAMMTLASKVGISTPNFQLVHRDQVQVPHRNWRADEHYGYAVDRFDRRTCGSGVHMEDFCQVFNLQPDKKYNMSANRLAAGVYRRRDIVSLQEFVRRFVFNVLITNGDAHAKNWSLLYSEPGRPRLSPAYDLVSTGVYAQEKESMAMKWFGTRDFYRVRLRDFAKLGKELGVDVDLLEDVASETVDKVLEEATVIDEPLAEAPRIRNSVHTSIRARAATLRS